MEKRTKNSFLFMVLGLVSIAVWGGIVRLLYTFTGNFTAPGLFAVCTLAIPVVWWMYLKAKQLIRKYR